MDPELIKPLASNGPWAIMAGFLLSQILKAWNADRTSLVELMGQFKQSLDSLKVAVDQLRQSIEIIESRRADHG